MGGTTMNPMAPDFSDLSKSATEIGRDRIGDRFGPALLAALNSTGNAFIMLIDRDASPAALEQLARQMCAGRSKCRLLGWKRGNDMPNGFPIDDDTLATMGFAYMRATDTGLERALYNCKQFKEIAESRCMRERGPSPQPPAPPPPRTGTEVIKLAP
jgi:hypothetical protein